MWWWVPSVNGLGGHSADGGAVEGCGCWSYASVFPQGGLSTWDWGPRSVWVYSWAFKASSPGLGLGGNPKSRWLGILPGRWVFQISLGHASVSFLVGAQVHVCEPSWLAIALFLAHLALWHSAGGALLSK